MATTIKISNDVGDTIRFIDKTGKWTEETVVIYMVQKPRGFPFMVLYGYGDLFEPKWVSSHKINRDYKKGISLLHPDEKRLWISNFKPSRIKRCY